VTTALKWPGQDGQGSGQAANGRPAPWPAEPARPRRTLFERDPAWPITAMLVGWPLWWALGIGGYMPLFVAVPLGWRLYRWRATGSRRIKVPPAWGVWLLFLIMMVASVTMVSQQAPGTIPSPVSHRAISWALRAVQYIAVTVILLYAGNLTESEYPRRRLAWQLGLVAIYGIIFGFLDLAGAGVTFTSPLSVLVPSSLQQGDPTIYNMLHPSLNQAHLFSGRGRPSAPFIYTNWWGENVMFLAPWLLVAWRAKGTRRERRQRLIATAVLSVAIIPIILSFNRGVWIAVVCTGLYLAVRFVRQGGLGRLGALLGVVLLLVVVVLASPLRAAIQTRLSSAGSATGRANLAVLVAEGIVESPMLGYGDTRHARGSQDSITLGRTAVGGGCSQCGNADVGVNGQFWLLLYTDGIPAALFYVSFFAVGVWRFRRDKTPYGVAGLLVLLLSFVFMFVYTQLGPPLSFMMLGYVLLWKNDRVLRGEEAPAEEPAVQTDRWGAGVTAGARPGIAAGTGSGTLVRRREI
jgi:hypothetical protein